MSDPQQQPNVNQLNHSAVNRAALRWMKEAKEPAERHHLYLARQPASPAPDYSECAAQENVRALYYLLLIIADVQPPFD
jgi:hypothetical protein